MHTQVHTLCLSPTALHSSVGSTMLPGIPAGCREPLVHSVCAAQPPDSYDTQHHSGQPAAGPNIQNLQHRQRSQEPPPTHLQHQRYTGALRQVAAVGLEERPQVSTARILQGKGGIASVSKAVRASTRGLLILTFLPLQSPTLSLAPLASLSLAF